MVTVRLLWFSVLICCDVFYIIPPLLVTTSTHRPENWSVSLFGNHWDDVINVTIFIFIAGCFVVM